MEFIQAALTALVGSIQLLVTEPLQGGIVAYLSTTVIFCVALPGAVGIVFSIFGKIPRFLQIDQLMSWWWKVWITIPASWIWSAIQWLAPRLARLLMAIAVACGRGIWRLIRPAPTGPPGLSHFKCDSPV